MSLRNPGLRLQPQWKQNPRPALSLFLLATTLCGPQCATRLVFPGLVRNKLCWGCLEVTVTTKACPAKALVINRLRPAQNRPFSEVTPQPTLGPTHIDFQLRIFLTLSSLSSPAESFLLGFALPWCCKPRMHCAIPPSAGWHVYWRKEKSFSPPRHHTEQVPL